MKNELVSADEAVARLINIDFLPAAYTIENLLEGFVSEARDRCDAAKADPGQEGHIIGYRLALKICEQRLELAGYILEAIQIQTLNGRLTAKNDGASRTQSLNWGAVQEWALENIGIVVPEPIAIIESVDNSVTDKEPDDAGKTKAFDKLVGKGLSRAMSKSMLVTLYALAKTHADKHPSALIRTATGTLIIDAVAKEIVEMVSTLSKQQKLTGQSSESIKDRLEAAEDAWKMVC